MPRRHQFRFCVALACLAILTTNAGAQDVSALYKKVVRSAVFIVTPAKGGYGMGSGSLVDREQGIIITNYHVVGDAESVFIQFPVDDDKGNMITDKKKYLARIREELAMKGKVLKTDMKRDLAIVKLVDKVPATVPVLPLATKEPGRGALVWNIGSPGAVEQVFSITEGTVRAVSNEKFEVGGDDPKDTFTVEARIITTSNPTNQGDSGGPLVNAAGEMVGVTQSGKRNAKLVSNFIDVSEVKAFLKENNIEVKVTPAVAVTPPKKEAPMSKETVTPKETPKPKETVNPLAEKASVDALRLTKLLATNPDNRDKYIDKLNEIIKKYPGTSGAKEAQRLIDGLKK